MGKLSLQRYNKKRMTEYNNAKALQDKQSQIVRMEGEVLDLKQANFKLKTELENIKIDSSHLRDNFKLDCSQKMDEALASQKNHLNKKHILILEKYSEDLTEKYRKQFNESAKLFESDTSKLKDQIKMLSLELEATKQALLSASRRKPVYSPGKYCDNG